MIRNILSNEAYIGNSVYNRKSFRLRQVMKKNPPELWIRATGLYEPIVDQSIFQKAQLLLKEQYVRLSGEQLLKKLREALAANGKLSVSVMEAIDGMPSPALFAYRFGSLREAFRQVGYVNSGRDFDYLDARQESDAELLRQASLIATRIRALGAAAIFDADSKVMTVDGKLGISLRMARYYIAPRHAPAWLIHRRIIEPAGLILAMRLDARTNREVMDYFLLPLAEMAKERISLTATSRSRFAAYCCPTVDDVLRAVMTRVAAVAVQGLHQTAIISCGPQEEPVRSNCRSLAGSRVRAPSNRMSRYLALTRRFASALRSIPTPVGPLAKNGSLG